MANLSITTRCNQACDYCFARGALSRLVPEQTDMSLETFDKALDFLERSGIDQVRLLGGEPTLHPAFDELLDRSLARFRHVMVFSNGKPGPDVLARLESIPPDRLTVLINATAFAGADSAALQVRRQCLDRLGQRVMLGLNVYRPDVEPEFLLDLIDACGLIRGVRLGLAHPCGSAQNAFLHALLPTP